MRPITKCECGRRMSKYSRTCKVCHEKRMAECLSEAKAIVSDNKCPRCGAKLVRNNALAGWFQCVQYGTWKKTHGSVQLPDCGFQCFTEMA